jgi:hypothetical protein
LVGKERRLLLAGFWLGFARDRRLMREAGLTFAIRWFCGYGPHEMLSTIFYPYRCIGPR